MNTCQDIEDLLSAYLDRELSDSDKAEVSAHVEHCARCTASKQALLGIKESLRALPMPKLPAEVIARIEAETLWKPRWWQSVSFRRRFLPVAVGVATAMAAWGLWRLNSPQQLSEPLEMAQPHPSLLEPVAYSGPEKDGAKEN